MSGDGVSQVVPHLSPSGIGPEHTPGAFAFPVSRETDHTNMDSSEQTCR